MTENLNLLTPAQVAARLNISRSYCTRMLNRLHVPVIRLGHRTVRYRLEDIDALIAHLRSSDGGGK